ncbi:MAG: MarR family transcriptional regulator [Rhizobiaceae bacterium]
MDQTVAPIISVDQVDIGPLDSTLGFLLRMAQLQVYDDLYAELGSYDLKPGEFSVLTLILKNPGIRQGILASRLKIKRAHMTKQVRMLEDKGYVSRTIPNEDRRAVELDLTSSGREFVKSHWDVFYDHAKAEASRLSRLSSEEQEQLLGLLRKFIDLEKEEAL